MRTHSLNDQRNTKGLRLRLPIGLLFFGGLVLAALLLTTVEVLRFASDSSRYHAQIIVAGIPVNDLQPEDAVKLWQTYYAEPVVLDFQDNRILLQPAAIGFHVDSPAMLAQLQTNTAQPNILVGFWNYLWRRQANGITVDLKADYQPAKLREFLEALTSRYSST